MIMMPCEKQCDNIRLKIQCKKIHRYVKEYENVYILIHMGIYYNFTKSDEYIND